MSSFSHEHLVSFEETSLVGNVYYANYILWQGHCRERFIAEYCPDVTTLLLQKKVALFTRSCECNFCGNGLLTAGETVRIDMSLEKFRGGRMTLQFQYHNQQGDLIASGNQVIHCKSNQGGNWVPDVFPISLLRSLIQFAKSSDIQDELMNAIEFKSSKKSHSNAVAAD